MKKIKFLNPTFRPGYNLTVRRGDKWLNSKGETLQIVDANTDEPTGQYAAVIHTEVKMFKEISNLTCQLYAHDLGCRTTEGLFEAMQKAYPDFERPEKVALVFFTVEDEAQDD